MIYEETQITQGDVALAADGGNARGGPVLPECRTYSVEDVQEMLGIGRSSAYALVNRGVFRSVRIGGIIRISRRSFDEWFYRTFEEM